MALYVKFIETTGQGFVGVSRGRSDFKVNVEFYADEDGVRELTQVCAKDEPVRVISGNSTYVAQYQQQAYEERIRTLEAANSGLLSQVRELERQVRRIARDDARLGIEPIGVLMDGPAKSGDLISIDLSKNFLTSGRVSVQAMRVGGAPEIQYPAEGVVLNSVNQYGLLSVSVGQWTVGAFFTGAGDPKVGDLVELTLSGSGDPPTIPEGTIVARKRLPKVEDRDSWMSDAARMANEMGVSQEEAIARVNRMARDGILAAAVESAPRKGLPFQVRVGGEEGTESAVSAAPVEEGDEVRLTVRPGMAIRWEAAPTGRKAPKRREKEAPARFNVLELDED